MEMIHLKFEVSFSMEFFYQIDKRIHKFTRHALWFITPIDSVFQVLLFKHHKNQKVF